MKWNDLTMKERSDLMSLFLKAGVGSLSDMRHIYDGEQDNEPILDEYGGGTLKESKVTATLTRNQWNKLYKEGKVSLSQIPWEYQSWIEGENSDFKKNVTKAMNDFGEQYVAPVLLAAASMNPIIGAASDAVEIGTQIASGNYLGAGLTAASAILPDILQKPLIKAGKAVSKRIKARKLSSLLNKLPIDEAVEAASSPKRIDYTPATRSESNIISIDGRDIELYNIKDKFNKLATNNVNTPLQLTYTPVATVNILPSNDPVIYLPEHTASSDRQFLKNFNLKFNKRYGYAPIPLEVSKIPGEAEKRVKAIIERHNTFARGVSDFESVGSRLTPEEKKFVRASMIKAGYDPNNLDDRIKYSLIFPAPLFKNYGRVDVDPSTLARVGDNGLLVNEYGRLGTIYTSNSLGTGMGYTYTKNLHNTGIVRRKYKLSNNRDLWHIEGDFDTAASKNTHNKYVQRKNVDEYLRKTTGIGLDETMRQMLEENKGALNSNLLDFDTPISQQQTEILKSYDLIGKSHGLSLPKANNYLEFVRNELMTLDLKRRGRLVKGANYRKKAVEAITKQNKQIKRDNYIQELNKNYAAILANTPHNIWNTYIYKHHLPIIPYPVIAPRSKDAYTHMIFRGNVGETEPLLEYLGRADEFISSQDIDKIGPITRQHYGNSADFLSRKTRKYGGELMIGKDFEHVGWVPQTKFYEELGGVVEPFSFRGSNNVYIHPDGGELKPATITEKIGRKWDNLYWQKFREPRDYSDEVANTPECAQWSNAQLRKMGYNIWGDAWTRSNQRVKKVFSGYDGLTKPDEYTYSGYRDYVLGAADNVKRNFNWRDLQEGDIVGMYFRGSPNYQKAFLNGANGEAQTHTGHVVYRKGKPYIAHNVHGDIKLNKAKKVIGRRHPYGIVSVYRPYDYGGNLTFY